MTYKGKGGKQYSLAQAPFAQGGEGKVYTVNGNSKIVAKLYKNGLNTVEKERKLITMVDNPPDKDVMTQISWPLDVLYDSSNRFVGFIMPKLDINEDLNVIYEYGSTAKYPNIPWTNKIIIAKNLCAVLDAVHSAGHVVGDLNPKNISVDPSTGHIVFVDTDSYHIEDNGTVYRCNVGMPEYLPAEIQRKMKGGLSAAPLPTFSKDSDNFALAVHIFQLLMNGTHPFACKILPSTASIVFPQPTDNILNGVFPFMQPAPGTTIPLYAPSIDVLPQYMQDLFNRAFITGHIDPKSRPNAEEWYNALTQMENELVHCKSVSHHEYHSSSKNCPWCEVDKRFSGGVSGGKKRPLSQGTFSGGITPPPRSWSTSKYGNSTGTYGGGAVVNPRSHTSTKKKAIIISISILLILLLIGGIVGGVQYKNGMDAANRAVALIDALPDNIYDYTFYGEQITDAYNAYQALTDWQKGKVSNSDKLLRIVPEYNNFVVNNLRSVAENVSVETVESTSYLADTVKLYEALNEDQKALLSSEEIFKFDNYAKANQVIVGLNGVRDDILDRYGEIGGLQQIYHSIDPAYLDLVYNYALVDSFAETYNFYNLFVFEQNESGSYSIKIKDPNSLSGAITLPSVYNGQSITTIPEGAFKGCKNITSLVVPNTVTEIGKGAFEGCNKIQELTLPFTGRSEKADAYEAVLGYVFGYTTKQGSAHSKTGTGFVNSSVSSVDGAIWQYSCYNGASYTSSQSYLLSYYYYIPSALKNVTVTKQTDIKDGAFNGCGNIESVKFASGLTGVGASAFQNCESLTSVNSDVVGKLDLSGEYGTIGAYAFKNCEEINDVSIPTGVLTIGEYAFENLAITTFVLPDTVETIYVGALYSCDSLQSITVPFTGKNENANAYEAVLGYIFGYTTKQGSAHTTTSTNFVNTSVATVEGTTWQYSCYNGGSYTSSQSYLLSYYYYIPSSLRSVVITEQKEVKAGAFNSCGNIIQITYNQELKEIQSAAFQNCVALSRFNSTDDTTISLKGNIYKIDSYAFNNCNIIENLLFDDNVKVIGAYAFANCKSVKELNLPNLLSIGDYAFSNLVLITDVKVSSLTESIGKGAFEGCKKVETVVLPFTGKSKNANAFEAVFGYVFGYTTKQGSAHSTSGTGFINTSVSSVDGTTWQYSCYNGSSYTSSQDYLLSYYYYIPSSVKSVTITNQSEIKVAAFNGCTHIENVKYSMGITGIGTAAFQNCENLLNLNSNVNGKLDLNGEYTAIGGYAFKNCELIDDISIPIGVLTIGEYAFENLAITTLVIPDTVETIHIGALYSCDNLQNITLPFTGKSEGASAYEAVLGFIFGYTTKQGSAHTTSSTNFINTSVATVEGTTWQYSCYNGSSYTSSQDYLLSYYYYIPSSLKYVTITKQDEIKTAAFNGCTKLLEIDYKQSIKSTGSYAFQNCSATVN